MRERGIDVVSPKEIRLRGASDEAALVDATGNGRGIVTDDSDCLRLHRMSQDHAGIAYCGPRLRSTGQIIKVLESLRTASTPEEMAGRLICLSNILRSLADS